MNRVIGERDLDAVGVDEATARSFLREMVRARRFDERALSLQRRGWMSGYPSFRGQEASQVGAAHAMADDDWLVPTYRSNAMQLALGVPMRDILAFRRGRSEFRSDGCDGRDRDGDDRSVHDGDDHDRDGDAGGERDRGANDRDGDDRGSRDRGAGDRDGRILPQAVPIATQIPHATGIGMARNYRDREHAAVCYFGDGATSEGDFHEGLNFAGVFDAPVVFFCENNYWAISLPYERQTASDTIAGKARAYGFEGMRVDGNDPLAVYECVSVALSHARDGEPVLVESLTYRQGAHTTSDDPSRYEDRRSDLPAWRTRDPIDRYAEYLREQGVVDDAFVEEARAEADEEVDEAVAAAEAIEPADPDDVFEHVYADLTPPLAEQREWLRSFLAAHDPDEIGP